MLRSPTQNFQSVKRMMTRTKRLTISLVALWAAVLVSAAYFTSENRHSDTPIGKATSGDSTADSAERTGTATAQQSDLPSPSHVVDVGEATQTRHPFPEVPTSRRGMPLESDGFMAKSVAEQEWLDRNGYPNEAQWEALMQASDAQLEQAALAGDTAAQVLLNQKRMIAGDDSAIVDTLVLGAMGSGFAIDMLAATLAGPLQDPVSAYAMVRAGEMRGNYRSGPGREMLFNVPLTSAQRTEGEAEALEIFRQLAAIREARGGGNAPLVDPRPIDP